MDKVVIKFDSGSDSKYTRFHMLPRTDTRLTEVRMPGDAMVKFECRMIDEKTNDR